MKLYLNHFYNKSYKSKNEIIRKIKKDIESKIKIRIKVNFIDTFIKEPKFIYLNNIWNLKTFNPPVVDPAQPPININIRNKTDA